MNLDLVAAIKTIEYELAGRLTEAYGLVNEFKDQTASTKRLPTRTLSGLTTELVKTTLAELEGVLPPTGARAEYLLISGDNVFSFRIHRARIAGSKDYDVQDLSPRLNRITAKGSPPDFVFLWVAEGGDYVDTWAVVPQAKLAAQTGTQLAGFRPVRGRRWAAAYRLPKPEVSVLGLEELSPEPVVPEVDLGIKPEEEERRRRRRG